MQHIFIVGSKSIGAYGGYETFVYKLTEYHQNNKNVKYHIACKANGDGCMDETKLDNVKPLGNNEFEFHNAHCFKLNIPKIGPAQAIYYDVAALKYCCRYIKEHNIEKPIVYILACRIGPFMRRYTSKIHKLGGKVYVNPDGHEWKRAKWSPPIRKYWKMSEKMMVRHADLLVCDSKNIEKYIHESYDGICKGKTNPGTTFIAYGCDTFPSRLKDDDREFTDWLKQKGLKQNEYYLVVGRFVPENNYETMIREFMSSDTDKDFALITNVSDKFLEELKAKTGFDKDSRIKFVGTVYNQELLKKIRENAYGYFHGHEVGGTNPSLLEALGYTKLNLLLNVGFNREVAEDAALYWTKEKNNLAGLIEKADNMTRDEIEEYGIRAKNRIKEAYSWEYICDKYIDIFVS